MTVEQLRAMAKELARIFHEFLSRDRGDGCNTGQPQGIGSEGNWIRGVLEQYVAGSDTRGRPEGRSDTRSQQAIHEICGLGIKTSNLRKSELIRSIQRAEGNFDCFGTAEDYCDQINCLFLQDCLS
jgi:hypothetical protein